MHRLLPVLLLLAISGRAPAQLVEAPPAAELESRRRSILEIIDQGVAFLPGAQRPAAYVEFRQSADFFYLTGLEVPDAYLVLDGMKKSAILFVPPRDTMSEQWEGPIYGTLDDVRRATGIEDVRAVKHKRGADPLPEVLDGVERPLWLPFEPEEIGVQINDGAKSAFNARSRHPWERFLQRETGLKQLMQEKFPGREIKNLSGPIRTARTIKQPSEIAVLRKASQISAKAMVATIRGARPGRYEYELGAINDFESRLLGAQGPAYYAIVGSGPNSCILHYWRKNRRLEDGDIIVVDAACSYSYYVSDVTRAFPANGKFTPEQRHVYQAVLEAQEACIAEAKPGVPINRLERLARDVLGKYGLKEYFTHGLSHHVGMAVHDPGGAWGPLHAGNVLTIEPGAYLGAKSLGVRIEDVILITEDGCEVLTKDAPKSIEQVEALMVPGAASMPAK
jgi:Xaa-Pro aminopeptidase